MLFSFKILWYSYLEKSIVLHQNLNIMKCTKCGSSEIIRFGIVKWKQRYKCKSCGITFREATDKTKSIATATQLYFEGIKPQWIEKLSNKKVSADTVRRWIKKTNTKGNLFCKETSTQIPDVSSPSELPYEVKKAIEQNLSKLNTGVLIIGLDVKNPFSYQIRVNPKKTDY